MAACSARPIGLIGVANARPRGAGIPDLGPFLVRPLTPQIAPEPWSERLPERGVIESKPAGKGVFAIAKRRQVTDYLDRYGKVQVTNYREFLLVTQDENGNPPARESYRLADSEAAYWAQAAFTPACAPVSLHRTYNRHKARLRTLKEGRVMDGWRRGARVFIGLAAALWMLGAACSKSSTPSNNPGTTPPASAAGITLQQGAGGLVFSPATFSVKQGASITVKNVGSASHTFTISGKGIDVVNDPGKSQNVTINLAPGTYPFICRFHESLGMKGTLTVTG